MKKQASILAILLLAALPLTLTGQTLVIDYMKVTQESESLYLEVEKQWKEIHRKRMEVGLINGWQLWKNRYAGYADEYQYATIAWYDDWKHSFKDPSEDQWASMEGLFTEELVDKTLQSRVLVRSEVNHSMASAENNKGGKLIVINHMKPAEGKWDDYVEGEREIFKPLFEEAIERGYRQNWGMWITYPYQEGQTRLITVDGFKDAEQMLGEQGGEDLFSAVHPDLDPSEISKKMQGLREMEAVEVWELVDAVFPED